MPQPARVKLTSTNIKKLDGVCAEILGIGKKTGVKIKGPIPLPLQKYPIIKAITLASALFEHHLAFLIS